jgi:hypothetical protein
MPWYMVTLQCPVEADSPQEAALELDHDLRNGEIDWVYVVKDAADETHVVDTADFPLEGAEEIPDVEEEGMC